MKCAICGRPVTSGIVLHTECFERRLWHNADEHPQVHTEFYEIDGEETPCEVSHPILCETKSGRYVVARFDGETSEWFCDDGSMPKVYRWMHIEE